jgi:ADYC domain
MKDLLLHPVSWLAVLIAASVGCVDQPHDPDEDRASAAILSPYVGQQGRLLLGFKNPDTRLFSFAASLPATRAVGQGQLVAGTTAGAAFTGVTFTGTDGVTTTNMRIAQVIAPTLPGQNWEYLLEQQDSSGAWGPACDAPPPLVPSTDPPEDPPHAIAMPGFWFGALYWVHADQVTFSCKTGVVAKCNGWGFPVTAQWPHVTKNGTLTNASGPDLAVACTRMARADYCANGMPNTLAGTPIQIDDVFTHTPPLMPGYYAEAAWAGKAINDSQPQAIPVVCLSKLRWSTLPLGGNCPLQLPDPRITGKAKFCEAYSTQDLENRGAVMYSASTFIDAGLYTYTDPSTQLRLTTASLVPQAQGELPAWTLPSPPAEVPFPAAGQPVRFEATVFAANLPVAIPDANLVKLVSYRCHGDLMTTTSTPTDPSCAQIALEGYVYPPNTSNRAPLRRWSNPATKRSNTTAVSPTNMMADGWSLEEVVGGVLRAGIDINLRWTSVAGATYTVDAQTPVGWVNGCIDSVSIGSTPSFVFRGTCVGLSNGTYPLNHTDIVAFRVTATVPGLPPFTGTVAYDGFSSDPYVDVTAPHGLPSALAVRWTNLGAEVTYSVDLQPVGGDYVRCATTKLISNDLSYVHTGKCWSAGTTVPVTKVSLVRVCAYERGTAEPRVCREAKDDGRLSHIVLKL